MPLLECEKEGLSILTCFCTDPTIRESKTGQSRIYFLDNFKLYSAKLLDKLAD